MYYILGVRGRRPAVLIAPARVRTGLHRVRDGLLAPDMVEDMAKEMRAYYEQCVVELRARRTHVAAEVEELNKRIARLQERLKGGDPDLTDDELVEIIEKAKAKRAELLASTTPEDRHGQGAACLAGRRQPISR